MKTGKPVTVKQLPAILDHERAQTFLRDLEPVLKCEQPRVVLDLSRLRRLDSAGVDTLLKCLQEAMRRDGDVKLAAVSPECQIVLELTRVDRLFEIFENPSDAAESFYSFRIHVAGIPMAVEPIKPEHDDQDWQIAS